MSILPMNMCADSPILFLLEGFKTSSPLYLVARMCTALLKYCKHALQFPKLHR